MKEYETVEVIEKYRNGVLIKRTYNGKEQLLPDISQCEEITFISHMTRKDAELRYGNYYIIPNLDVSNPNY